MFIRASGPATRFIFTSFLSASLVFFWHHHSPPNTNIKIGSLFQDLYTYPSTQFQQLFNAGEEEGTSHDPLFSRLVAFWVSLEGVLSSVRPKIEPIAPSRIHIEQSFETAWPKVIHEELISLSPPDLKRLKESHAAMLSYVETLAPKLPYIQRSRGVVMTAGERYISVLLVSIRMLRRSGSKLPVEVFFDTRTASSIHICSKIFPSLNAKCLHFSDLFASTPLLSPLKSYQLKIFALLFSSFQDILFLDADAFPAQDPDHLLRNEPFASRGLVTWPDFWSTTTSPTFWEIAGLDEPVEDVRASTESGIILISKEKHAKTLLLIAYYNYFGPGCYYPLLSQGAQGEGDKETFLSAAMALNASFYSVKAPVRVVGDFFGEKWESSGMKQGDPIEDFRKNYNKTVNAIATDFFVHHNNIKLDPKNIFNHPLLRNFDGEGERRLWGTKENATKDYGKDLEKEMWEELVVVACSLDSETCDSAQERYENVYAD